MNVVLWVIAGLVAAAFLFSGMFKLALTHEKYVVSQSWAADAPRWTPKVIGALEVAGAIGVVLPAVIDVVPMLVPIAATGLALVMLGAVVMHVRRSEFSALVPSVVLLILAVVVAWGRFGPYAF
ncbi:DoxX family protein [Cryptosporangium sp. NPDC051539]|uniref:DoxX family protein n=1 Tax=Cryptosporangium sp. NPDC051539 TaxID=3363962 RepID=UPI00379AB9F8